MHELLGRRRRFLTAKKRLLTNQVFRDLYGTDTIDVEQRLKITRLTFLFTDLKGSTELYERVGDLVAFDLVRAHFRALNEIAPYSGDRLGHLRRGRAGFCAGHLVPQNSFGRWGALDNNAPSLTAQPSGESMLTRQNEARDPAAPAADSARLFK